MSASLENLARWINPVYVGEYSQGTLHERKEFLPFPHVVLPNFFSDRALEILLNQAERNPTEMSHRKGIAKSTDWYWGAFAELEYLRFFLGSDMRAFLNALTGRTLIVKKGSIPQFNVYRPGSRGLPVHTDLCEEVNMVSLVQLSQGYVRGLGGELVFYKREGNRVMRSLEIAPECNKLILFEVSAHSYHGVDDMAGNWTRRTITYDWLSKEDTRSSRADSVSLVQDL